LTLILVVDDDPAILRTLSINLRARDYEVETARDGRAALHIVRQRTIGLILLDLGLPDMDGVAVIALLRSFTQVPIVVLSARHESDDKVEALNLGADDYVTKPFGMDELLARIRAALRHASRRPSAEQLIVQTPTLRLDLGERVAQRSGHLVHLTPTEWRLIEALTKNKGQLVRQTQLLQEVWGPSYHRESNYLRVYLAQLRRKLEEEPSRPRHFITEPGVGYRFIP
jgi:two-component system, OmpR family, KDP operon response regulator KdpE